jgi:hypothetical protein
MARYVGAAAMLPESGRKDLAIQALARSTTISDLSVRHGVSRKFVYQQAHKAGAALDEVFLSGAPEDDMLFQLTVSKTWLRQVIVALTLICCSSYRGVVEFLRDLLGVPISIGTVHHEFLVREACVLHRLPGTSTAYWQGWNRLRANLGDRFHRLFDAVSRAMAQTPRSGSLVENLNSRLRNYFTLRHHLGGSYLDLPRFFLNHRRFMRSRRANETAKARAN